MKKRIAAESKIESGRWLTTYSDLMNNLLVLFMMLYIMSVIDLEKFKQFTSTFSDVLLGTTPEVVYYMTPTPPSANYLETITSSPMLSDSPAPFPTPTVTPEVTPDPSVSEEEYDALFARINLLLEEKGYLDKVSVEKKSDIIYLRFREGVFFFPDSYVLKSDAYPIIDTIGSVILESYDLINGIEISGHTAKVLNDPPTKTNLFSWELSTNRALTVLKYLVQQCDMPQEKLSVSGYSCNQLYVEGDTEELMAQNRRVEIRLSRKVFYN